MRIYKAILYLFVVGLSVSGALAAEREIVLYPSGAGVRVTIRIQQQDGLVSLPLPAGMVENSLRVSVPGAEVQGIEFQSGVRGDKSLSASPAAARLVKARQDWRSAQKRVEELENGLVSLNARLELWLMPSVPGLAQVGDLHKLEASMVERTAELMAERADALSELEAAQLVADRLAEAVRDMLPENVPVQAPVPLVVQRPGHIGGQAPSPEYEMENPAPDPAIHESPVKTALVRLAPEKAGQTLPGELEAVLTYRLDNCGWTPRYVLEARTAEKVVLVRREAVIHQRTGEDWQGAHLRLSTLPPSANAELMDLRPWLVRPGGPLMQVKARMAGTPAMNAMNASEAMDEASPMPSAYAAPARSEEAASAVWELGIFTVLSGQPQQVTLDAQRWKAVFYRLLRPSVSKFAWLMATVTPDGLQLFEAAEADLYVESRYLGRSSFSFSGSTGDLAFGRDMAVTATMEADSKQSGESGFLSKNRTQAWAWTIKARNAHNFAVEVWVEDAAPQSGDERIELRVESQPKPVSEKHILRWKLPLPPGAESSIRHKVAYAAPEDIQINPGR